MIPFIAWLVVLCALGYVVRLGLDTTDLHPAGWLTFLVSLVLGAGLTVLAQWRGIVSRYWFRSDR